MLSYFQEDSQSGSSLADPLVANRVKNLYGMQTGFGVVCHPSFSFLTSVHAIIAFIVVLFLFFLNRSTCNEKLHL